MATISMDKELAINLLESRLREIVEEINSILNHWKEESATSLIDKSRNGQLPESEMDAIALTNLVENQIEIEKMLLNYGGN